MDTHSAPPPRPKPAMPPPAIAKGEEYGDLYGRQEFRIYQDAIQQLSQDEDQLPSLPAITLQVRKALSNPNMTHLQLANILAKDPSLTAILLKHASSSFYRTVEKPKNLQDVISRIGLTAIDSLVLAHSLKSLFVMKDPNLKKLYKKAWQRQVLKACISFFLAKQLKFPNPDNAMAASLLSEVGTLAMLVALQRYDAPTEETYQVLCRNYSKHLGAVLLAKWGLDQEFSVVLRKTGQWQDSPSPDLQLVDIVNLALFHALHHLSPSNDLGDLTELAAYKKLAVPHRILTEEGLLLLVEENFEIIKDIASTFE